MFLYFLFPHLVLTLPVALLALQAKLTYSLSRRGKLPFTVAGMFGLAVATLVAWFAILTPIAIMFAIGCPGATRMSVAWMLGRNILFTEFLLFWAAPFVVGVMALALGRRGTALPGFGLSKGRSLALAAAYILLLGIISLNGDKIAYGLVVPEARYLPLYPHGKYVAAGKLDYSYGMLPHHRTLHFHTSESADDVRAYYARVLSEKGWKVDTQSGPNSFAATWVDREGTTPFSLNLTMREAFEQTGETHGSETMIDIDIVRVPNASKLPYYPGASEIATRDEKDEYGFVWRATSYWIADEPAKVQDYYKSRLPERGWVLHVPYNAYSSDTLYDPLASEDYLTFTAEQSGATAYVITESTASGKTKVTVRARGDGIP